MKYWSKSTLTIFRYVSAMCNSIDKNVLDLGNKSNSALSRKYNNIYHTTDKMIELIDRKRKMLNLKIASEDTVSRMTSTNKRIITLVFFDGVKSELVAQLLGISLRTFFRKKNDALKEFETILQAIGYDEEFFEREYSCEKWFMAVYDEILAKGINFRDEIDTFVLNRVFKEISKIHASYNTFCI